MTDSKSTFRRLPPAIRGKAHSLESAGVNNVAWKAADLPDILGWLHHQEIGILGGDVYRVENGDLQLTYDSWSCERHPAEQMRDYVHRSHEHAIQYVQKHGASTSGIYYYALVLDITEVN
ncbi:MAG TPA: Imm40 family immunity protein [Longimicrobium sp.]|nr:Imm40 family immunity protein [Longimicrobium sp.]